MNYVTTEHQVLASLCRDSFYDFVREFWFTIIHEKPVLNWHVRFLCDELQAVAERVFKGEKKLYDLVINVPPSSSKSTICSQMFPAWCWTRMPEARLICCSYSTPIAIKDSLKTRDIVNSELYADCFPGIDMREDQDTKGLFVNTQKGSRMAAGVHGTITGTHAHFLIVDDPLNPQEAHSDADLRNCNRWMEQTLPTRKVNYEVTPLVLVQQRLHQQDPSGEMLAKDAGKGKVRHICLPGELTDDVSPKEVAGHYVDGLLDPVRLTRATLQDLKDNMGEYGYSAQVVQRPVPKGAGLFEADKFVLADDYPDELTDFVRSWDKAGTDNGGAWSVGVLMARDRHKRFWVLDVVRGQWNAAKREEMILTTAEHDGDGILVIIETEGGSAGKESSENSVRNMAGFNVKTFHPTGDKETRAYPYASQVGAGNVSVLKRRWTQAYIDELSFFPQGKFKDQVDASSGAFNHLAKKKLRIGAVPR